MEISSKTPIKAKEVSDALENKANLTHPHKNVDISDFSHRHNISEITDFSHRHNISEITDFSHTHNDRYYIEDEIDTKLNNVINPETLNVIKNQYYYVPDDCIAGITTVILDGIECLCVATDVTIQGSDLRRIAVDKNHDLGYYQKYVGIIQDDMAINQIKLWRWGGYGTAIGYTYQEVGYGLKNTIRCLANPVNYTKGTYTGTTGDSYPWLWQGVSDFRSSHSDNWFVPSANELKNYVYPYRSKLSFDTTTGDSSTGSFWSSSEKSDIESYYVDFIDGYLGAIHKSIINAVRLCRAF